MGTARTSGTPPRAASLIDIGARGRSPGKSAGRKHGDLTNPARPSNGMDGAPEILSPAQAPVAVGRSDAFDFKNIEELGIEIDADAVQDSELAHAYVAAPMLIHPDEGSDESGPEPESVEAVPLGSTGAVTIEAGSSATEWCLAEQTLPGHALSAATPETHAPRRDAIDAGANIGIVSERDRGVQPKGRASPLKIVGIAFGALLIVAGAVLLGS